MKTIKLIGILCCMIMLNPIYAQIGIGTTTPKAALDVVSATQGILPPRMTGTQIVALTVGADQNGMLIYATSTSGAITKIGYWYYDHTTTSWKPFDSDINVTNGLNIGSSNIKLGGPLTQATTISNLTATNKISFTGAGTDIFNIDTTTFSIDATNNRVGIGTAAPDQRLHIAANNSTVVKLGQASNMNGAIQLGGGNSNTTSGATSNWIDFYNGSGTLISNLGLRTDGFIINSVSGANTLMNTIGGNVGIGTATPASKLHIYSNSSASEVLRLQNNSATYVYTIANNFNNANFGSGAADYSANGYPNVLVQNFPGTAFFVYGDNIGPWADGLYDVGSPFARWRFIYATNGTINTSDARVKSDIKEIPYGLSTVMKMKPNIYNKFRGFDKTGESKLEVGFIAQDLKTLIPTAVEGNPTDVNPMGINYDQIIPVLTKAIQEQQVQIQAQSKEISELRAMIEKIAKH